MRGVPQTHPLGMCTMCNMYTGQAVAVAQGGESCASCEIHSRFARLEEMDALQVSVELQRRARR